MKAGAVVAAGEAEVAAAGGAWLWPEERIALLKRLWDEGLSATEVALRMGGGLTRNAVLGKVHRLKLPARRQAEIKPRPRNRSGGFVADITSERIRARQAARAGEAAPGEPQRRPVAHPSSGAARQLPAQGEKEWVRPEPQGMRMLSLVQLTERTCKWPVGDPLQPGFGFCGHPVEPGGRMPYCPAHQQRATRPPVPQPVAVVGRAR